mgnify:FL=1
MKLLLNHLYIVSTPIGNLEDITLRALNVLKNSDIILCEDTRRSLKLLNHYKIKKKLVSYHKFNEKKQLSNIIEHFKEGKILSLISDAGTPLLSDPGKILLNNCLKNKIQIVPIPGVSSITAAMSVSGFDDKFLFYGFLPKTENDLDKTFQNLSKYSFTQVFFVPSIKINFYLKKIQRYYEGRKIMIGRELTKIHEDFYRQDIDSLKVFKSPLKGEITLVISEKNLKNEKIDKQKIVNMAKKYLKKYSVKDTVQLILEKERVNKKEVYKLCLNIKNENSN